MKKPAMSDPILQLSNVQVTATNRVLLREVTLAIHPREVLAIVGASGAGKSTLLKTMNRLVDLTPSLRVDGQVRFHGQPIYAAGVDVDALRARIGILFQQPVIFPGSLYHNVLFGVRHLQQTRRCEWPEIAEQALRDAGLWDEAKDRLQQSALRLSVGQQQRLCLARTLAVQPEVLLMDEPTSALDPRSTEVIEHLMLRLKERHTIVLVTHNLRQAQRVADRLAFIGVRDGSGCLMAQGAPEELLQRRDVPEWKAYLSAEA